MGASSGSTSWKKRLGRLFREWRKRQKRKWQQRRAYCFEKVGKRLMRWWSWNCGLWNLVDLRTLWAIAMLQGLLSIAFAVFVTVQVLQEVPPSYLTIANTYFRTILYCLCCLGEVRLVHRAAQLESRSDLIAAAFLEFVIAAGPLAESLAANVTYVGEWPPPLAVSLVATLLTSIFLYLAILMVTRFGWRHFMLFGETPERGALFDRLLRFHSVLSLDAFCSLAQVRTSPAPCTRTLSPDAVCSPAQERALPAPCPMHPVPCTLLDDARSRRRCAPPCSISSTTRCAASRSRAGTRRSWPSR